MSVWTIVIYGVAAVLALQSLFALMTAYRKQALRRILDQEIRRREQEAAAKPTEPQTPSNTPQRKAA